MTVGSTAPRFDAYAKVSGQTLYTADQVPDDALHAKVVFTDQPHARLRSLEVSEVRDAPGVVAVITADDVPVNEYGLTVPDQPVLVGPEHDERVAVDTRVSRWEADHLFIVVAEKKADADAAAGLARTSWDPLPLCASIEEARSDTTLLHPETGSNVYERRQTRVGDMAAGWESADVVVEGTYSLPHQEHAYLEPESATAWMEDGVVHVATGGQWAWKDREQIAHALDLDEHDVRVSYNATGGAFGGKEDVSLQIVLALAARTVAHLGHDRPVHCTWSRAESIVGHHKRHRAEVKAKIGATSDGEITALTADVMVDAGAYNCTSNKVLGNLHLSVAGPYRIPNVQIDSAAVYTTSVPGGAFRGFGGPQGAFVAECQVNKLAAALNMDPVELRRRNALASEEAWITGTSMPQIETLGPAVEACAAAMKPASVKPVDIEPLVRRSSVPIDQSALRRGSGFALGFKNIGFSFGYPETSEAKVELLGDPDGAHPTEAVVFHGAADVGQGSHETLRRFLSTELSLSMDRISHRFADTATSGNSGSASASRLTFMGGNAVLGAVEVAMVRWRAGDRPAVGRYEYRAPATEPLDPLTGTGNPNFCYGFVAQAVDVVVDTGTGQVFVERVVTAHDVGRIINEPEIEGQIRGALAQAHGYTFSEELHVVDGRTQTTSLGDYLVPTVADVVANVEICLLESEDENGPYGARGVAEMPIVPFAPAVVAAIHDATGVWYDELPLKPDRVLAKLERLK